MIFLPFCKYQEIEELPIEKKARSAKTFQGLGAGRPDGGSSVESLSTSSPGRCFVSRQNSVGSGAATPESSESLSVSADVAESLLLTSPPPATLSAMSVAAVDVTMPLCDDQVSGLPAQLNKISGNIEVLTPTKVIKNICICITTKRLVKMDRHFEILKSQSLNVKVQ